MTARLDLAVAVPRERAGIDLIPEIGRDRTAIAMARIGRISETARRRALGLPLYEMPAANNQTTIGAVNTLPAPPESVQIDRRPMAPTTTTPRTEKRCPHCGGAVQWYRIYCSTRCYKMTMAAQRTAKRNDKPPAAVAKPAPPPLPYNSIHRIQAIVAGVYGIDAGMMQAAGRARVNVLPRQAAMALAVRIAGRSRPAVGVVFGNRDHTTVVHAIKAVDERLADASGRWADWSAKYREAERLCRAALDAPPDVVLPEVGDGG